MALRRTDAVPHSDGGDTGVMSVAGIVLYAVAYALLVGFFVIERFVRVRETRDMSRESTDRSSTTFVSIAMGTAFVLIPLTPLFNWLGVGSWDCWPAGVVGAVAGVGGLVIRYHAFRTLGRFFTRTLRETDEHELVTWGIYRHVRHPGYLSDILIFWGAALAMENFATLIVVVVLFVPAYLYRIHVEEGMLTDIFGQRYRDYQASSKRLVPRVW